MATRPMSEELIALNNKKLDMTLDELIKMSKRAASKAKKSRAPIKNQRASRYVAKGKPSNSQVFLDLRASFRQGALARKRSNFQGNQLPSAADDAMRKVEAAPFCGRASNPRGWAILKKSRSGTRVGQGAANGVVTTKPHTWLLTGKNAVTTQKPKTLDSLFANLRKQRINSLPQQERFNRPQLKVWQ